MLLLHSYAMDSLRLIHQMLWWRKGSYPMPHETSIIYHRHKGEGSKDWDSSTYNMILVNETSQFIENHLQNNNDNPYIAYVPLGAVHEPHLPPDKYIDGSNVAGEYATPHMDMLMK